MRWRFLKTVVALLAILAWPFEALATSPTGFSVTSGSGSSACVFSVTGSLLAPCTVMVDPATGVAIVTGAGTTALSGLGVQGVTGGVALPISAASLPLPTGASTAAGLTTINTTLGSPFQAGASIGNTSFAATQATAASLNATVIGTGTFATQLTGATNNINNISGAISLPTGAATGIADNAAWTAGTTPATSMGCEYTSGGATALTTGHVGVPGCTSARDQFVALFGNTGATMDTTPGGAAATNALQIQGVAAMTPLLANPGTAANWGILADNAAWTAGTTPQAVIGCEYTSGGATALTTGHVGTPGCTTGRALFTDKSSVGGTALTAAVSPYGTAPTGTEVEGVNAYITNTFTGLVNSADSIAPVSAVTATAGNSPVNSYSYLFDGTNFDRIRGTTGGHLIVEGSGTAGTASGGVFSIQGVGSMTPLLANPGTAANWSIGATGAAPPANITYFGANGSGATGGQSRGLINCDNHTFKHITTATDTLAVQGVASQTVYICGWRARAAGTATWYLENTASTNANCASTLTQITGVATEAANTGEVAYNPIWGGVKNTSANGLCINSTGTGGVDVDVWYAQL